MPSPEPEALRPSPPEGAAPRETRLRPEARAASPARCHVAGRAGRRRGGARLGSGCPTAGPECSCGRRCAGGRAPVVAMAAAGTAGVVVMVVVVVAVVVVVVVVAAAAAAVVRMWRVMTAS